MEIFLVVQRVTFVMFSFFNFLVTGKTYTVFMRNLLILKRYVSWRVSFPFRSLIRKNDNKIKENLLSFFLISGQLPDYHEVIENPMDFATVRNKLGNGSYATLEQFEVNLFN